MASTVRLSKDLQARAAAYATEIGVSLNALVAVALRDYVDARTMVVATRAVVAREVVAFAADRQPRENRQQRRAKAKLKGKGR